VAANIGQCGPLQVLVFEINRSQLVRVGLFRDFISQRIGIAETRGGKLVERRIGIGVAFLINRKIENACQKRGTLSTTLLPFGKYF
jgi:hypothetical protein